MLSPTGVRPRVLPGRGQNSGGMERRFPDAFYNPLSVGGAALAAICFATIVFLTGVEILTDNPPAYIGIISYVILPLPLLAGLLLIPLFGIGATSAGTAVLAAAALILI